MSRMYNDYLDDIGYFDIENDPECIEIVPRHGRQRPLYILSRSMMLYASLVYNKQMFAKY